MSKKFTKDYCKAIADALHEKEDIPKDREQLLRDAYNALCFDDPRVESEHACRILREELLNGKYALSERLVEGIRQATARFQVQEAKGESSKASEVEADEDNEEILPPAQAISSSTTVGYAILAVALFLEIPLRCCQANTVEEAQLLLGSYRGVQLAEDEVQDILEEKLEALSVKKEAKIETLEGKDIASEAQLGGYEEVWADESDPSDFVFESDAQELDWSAWGDTSFDPIKLSQPILTDGWPQVHRAISNLLQDLTYSKFAPVWKKKHADLLSELALILLVDPSTEPLRQWGIQPMNVLRDRILHHEKDCLAEYLTLVQSLIAVDGAQEDRNAPIAPASIVGLSSLSSLCTQAKYLKETTKIRKCVIECSEDLCSLVERAGETWVRVVWAVLPLLELISNTQADGTSLDASYSVSSTDAQWLLNSSLFRELILLYTKTVSSSVAVDSTRQQLLQCLQMLSLRSMTILGKYAWRVPELNKLIHEDTFLQNHIVDSILWSIMGQQLAAGGSALRFRNVKVVTVDSCRKMALRQFTTLCDQVVQAIETLRTIRVVKDSSNYESAWKEPIIQLNRFGNCLVSFDALSPMWKEVISKNQLLELLGPIKNGLASLPPPAVKEIATSEKTADNDKIGESLERPDNSFEHEVGMVYKAMKVLTMSLQQDETSRGLSSKTD